MKNYKLPTRKKCFEIISDHHVPLRVLRHSLAAAKLAVFLAKRFVEKEIEIDIDLLEKACLLHDIARVCDREKYKGLFHEDAAYEILKDDYSELASLIRKHKYMGMLDKERRPSTWEEKIIFYADMRVMHDKIAPLKERLEEGHKRNVHLHGSEEQSRIDTAKVDPLIFELEKEIFERIGLDPLQITDEFIDTYQ
jgi:putative nucleotidyltransferase with HDIG domain